MSDSTSQPSQVFPAAARWRLLGTVLVALQALVARAIHRAASWPRAPVITFQLLLDVMGAEWVRGEALAVGVAAVVVALVITVALLVPGVLAPRRLPGGDEG